MLTPLRLLLLTAALLLTTGCTSLSRDTVAPEVHLASVALLGVTMLDQEWELTLRVRNPNDHALKLRTVDYQIFLGEHRFARGLAKPDEDIPAMGDALVTTRVTTGLFATLKHLQALDYRGDKPLEYRIEGQARVGGIPLPLSFRHAGNIDFPNL